MHILMKMHYPPFAVHLLINPHFGFYWNFFYIILKQKLIWFLNWWMSSVCINYYGSKATRVKYFYISTESPRHISAVFSAELPTPYCRSIESYQDSSNNYTESFSIRSKRGGRKLNVELSQTNTSTDAPHMWTYERGTWKNRMFW